MANNRVLTALGLGILVLMVAFTFPVLIEASDGTTTDTREYEDNQEEQLGQSLSVTMTDHTNNSADVTLVGIGTSQTANATVNEGETETVIMDGTDVNVTVDNISGSVAILTIEYGPTMGWSESGKTIGDNLGLLIALLGFIIIVLMVGAVINS